MKKKYLLSLMLLSFFNGTKPFEKIGSFDLQTENGVFSYDEENPEITVFLRFLEGDAYTEDLWSSNFQEMVDQMPETNIIFVSSEDGYLSKIKQQAAGVPWKEKIFFINSEKMPIGGEVEEILETWKNDWNADKAGFLIDSDGFLRQFGLLRPPGKSETPILDAVEREVEYLYWEKNLQEKMKENLSKKEVILLDNFELSGGWGANAEFEAEFPKTEELMKYNNMEIYFEMNCPEKNDKNCYEWDMIANLHLCEDGKCNVLISRWITAYHRRGVWLTDITPFLAFLTDGGIKNFKINVPTGNSSYIMDMKIYLSKKNNSLRPVKAYKMWEGGAFNLDYNPSKKPYLLKNPESQKYTISGIMSGHGWGRDIANCAEFCNHTHHFFVNDKPAEILSDPKAGSGSGCYDLPNKGVVPNQFGTWPYGRAYWCPGWDLLPFNIEVENLSQKENLITYRALYENKPYSPEVNPDANSSGFNAEINMQSWLISWENPSHYLLKKNFGNWENSEEFTILEDE